MYIKGKSVDQIIGFTSGQTVGLRLDPVASAQHARRTESADVADCADAPVASGRPSPHSLTYLIDGEKVCEAFTAAELPQDGSVTLHLAISNAQGWAGTTRARGRRLE